MRQGHPGGAWNFDEKPLLVFWETTKACLLSCKHCRAEAITEPPPGELTTSEGEDLLREMARFDEPTPILILTGGDLLMRDDVFDLLEYAQSLNIRMAVAPSVTEHLTDEVIGRFASTGVSSISLSLDGAEESTHDGIRGIQGSWRTTVARLEAAERAGLRVQVNTAVLGENHMELPRMAQMVHEIGASAWELFFLIKTGRGIDADDLDPLEYEAVLNFLYDVSRYGVTVRTVEAPFFRRIAVQRREGGEPENCDVDLYVELRDALSDLLGPPCDEPSVRTSATRDGKGIIFVSSTGDVYPSGFLPFSVGNVKEESLGTIYRENSLLKSLRAGEFQGRCGVCPFNELCGGSRARAYAATGDPLGEDPACPYVPVESLAT